ncbi:Tripartite tricarboxylate transporter family receptor [compost metagenome]
MLYTWTAFIQSSALSQRPPYDVFTDFAPVVEVARSSFVLLGGASVPASTAKDFIALAQRHPGKYNDGSYGNGTSSHILGELLKQNAGIQISHVPYKAGGPMMTDLMAGHIPVAFVDFGTARANNDPSRLKPLAITSQERSPYFPATPSFAELGIKGLDLEGWYGVLAPARTDPVIVKKLAQEFTKALRSPEIKARLEGLGVSVVANPPEVFAAHLRRDEAQWKKIITDAAIRMD